MVTNFTANQIGDQIFAKLQEPYLDTLRVLSWGILAGVSSANTIGTLQITEGYVNVIGTGVNLDLVPGDKILVGSNILEILTVGTNSFTITTPATFSAANATWYKIPDTNNRFAYEWRYSQEGTVSDGGQMSEFSPLNINTTPADLLGQTFDPTKPLWIDIRAEVAALSDLHSISLFSVTFELETQAGTIESCPQICNDCNDPYLDGCTNVVVACEDPVYNPYSLSKPTAIYKELTELSTNMWGHEVKYFSVEPDKRSRDVVLMEYSLYNVQAQGQVKIMVPDNEMPTQDFQFDIFGMGWEDFEVHITKGQMEAAFGAGKAPRSRDYLYFPLMNRMYEVASVSFADEFNMEMTYWRVMLRKYEERTSTIVGDDATGQAIQTEMDGLTVGLEEVFGEELQAEYTQTSKPEQYQTVFSPVADGIRDRIHNSITISDMEIRNKWTIVSKNHYDLSTIKDQGIEALVYKKVSTLAADKNLAFTTWFQPNMTANAGEQTLFDGQLGDKGLKLGLNSTNIKAYVNDQTYQFDFGSNPQNGQWYGLVFNLNNTFGQIASYVYKLNSAGNRVPNMPIEQTLIEVMNQKYSITAAGWVTNKQYSLMPGKLKQTNIRLFDKTIGQGQHRNMLQQYVVRDNQLASIIDNAIPSIQLRRYNQSR
tara:strand:- start:1365 stop:3320 length:1956 start_codon:yes stop_codon:yes gene_type:complete